MVRRLQAREVHVHGVKRTRGFTLVEIMIVVAIVAVLAMIAIPNMFKVTEDQKLYGRARTLRGDLLNARQLAATGRRDDAWAPGRVTETAGIRFAAQSYQVFIDQDTNPLPAGPAGGELTLKVVDWSDAGQQGGYDPSITLVAPPAEIRFQRNGTLTTNANQQLRLRDTDTGQETVLTVLFGGSVRND